MLINGARLVADPVGVLFWPSESLLLVADLHLEKGSSFAARGQLLPPYDTAATLRRLGRVIARYQPAGVVCLGDSFHDDGAGARLAAEDLATLQGLMAGRQWTWIAGNHDPVPPAAVGGTVAAELMIGPLILRHEPRPHPVAGEIAGHLHPKAALRVRGRRISRRCFAGDGLRLVLPAFGAYTGGLDVLDEAFAPLFPGPFHAHLLGRERLHSVPSKRLARIA